MTTTSNARKLAKLTAVFAGKLADGRSELKEIDKAFSADLKDFARELARVVKETTRARREVFDRLDALHGKWYAQYEGLDEGGEIDFDGSPEEKPSDALAVYSVDAFDTESALELAAQGIADLRESLTEVDFIEAFDELALLPRLAAFQKEAENFEEPEDEDEDEEGDDEE